MGLMAGVGLGLVKVRGRSMEPTLHAGDRLVVLRGVPPRIGRLAIVRLPPDGDAVARPLAVKRVTRRDPDDPGRYWVEADNQGAGGVVDSWTLGQGLPRSDLRAVVLFRVPGRPMIGVPGPRVLLRKAGDRLFRR
jgi:signal peptidase I